MKKVLLSTSAVALVGAIASPASAAEWEMRVGGYMEQHIAFASSDAPRLAVTPGTDFDGIDAKQDAEIHFIPSITLDNGIKIGANVQLEGFASTGTADTIDEAYMFIKGSFGEVLLGSENSAGYKMSYGAPDVTFINVNSGSLTAFIPFSGSAAGVATGGDIFRGSLGTTFLENDRINDSQRFTYFTPRFSGFQLGVSYARDGLQDSNAQLNCGTAASGAGTCDYFDVAANYVNSFGDFNVAVSGRWGIGDAAGTGKNPQVFGFGLNLGFGGFTIGGSYAEQNNSTAGGVGLAADDGSAWDIGVSYTTGPWGFSFTYMHGKNRDEENLALGMDEFLDQYLLGVSYALATGVKLQAFGAYVDFNEQVGDGGLLGGNDIDGFVIGTGIKISF